MSGAVPSLFVWYSQLAFILLFFLGAQLQAVEDATVVNLVHFLVLLCLKKEMFLSVNYGTYETLDRLDADHN